MNKLFIFTILLSLPFTSQAAKCSLSGKITRVHQYTDGMIFIDINKSSDCQCPQKSRMAFHKDDEQNFYMSASLAALTTGKSVTLVGEDGDGKCPIHGNTAKLRAFYINAE